MTFPWLFSIASFKTRSIIRFDYLKGFAKISQQSSPRQVVSLSPLSEALRFASCSSSPMPRDEAAQLIRFNPISRESPTHVFPPCVSRTAPHFFVVITIGSCEA